MLPTTTRRRELGSTEIRSLPTSPRWFKQIYLPLAIASALLVVIFGILPSEGPARIGALHVAAILAVGIVAPLLLALGGGVANAWASSCERFSARLASHPSLVHLSLGLSAAVLYTALGWASSGWQPVLHDEFSYLFGARTLARGRLYNTPPPHPEFFDAMHVLHQGKWVTRYPPGHALALVPGVLVGWPPLGPIVLCAAAVLGTYQLARDRLGGAAGFVAGLLALQAPALVFISSGFLAQSTFWVLLTFFYVCLFRAGTSGRPRWAAAAGLLAGMMLLTRPFPAVAMGWPGAVWLLWRTLRGANGEASQIVQDTPTARRGGLLFVGTVVPFAGGVALFLAYNFAITGDPFYTPWQQYRDRYEPANTLGFSRGADEPRPDADAVHWRKLLKAEAMRADKQRFTPAEALRRAWLLRSGDGRIVFDPKRALDTLFPATCFLGLAALWVFAFRGRRWQGPDTVLLLAVVSHYAAYSFFHAARDVGYYALEPAPLVIYFTAAGAVGMWRHCRALGHRGLGLTAAALVLAALGNHILVQGPKFVADRREATACQRRFLEKLAHRPHSDQPAIVFVRYRRDHPFDQCDWINNPPSLDAPVLVVLDLGARNESLRKDFPARRAFVYDEASDRLLEQY